MNFGQIIERALKLVRNQTALWKLGLLALFTEGVTSAAVSGPPFPAPSDPKTDREFEQFVTTFDQWAKTNLDIVITLGVLIAAALVVLWYLSLRAKAGLVLSVSDLESGKSAPTFASAFRAGRPHVWRLIGLYLIFGLIISIVLAVPFAVVGAMLEGMSEEVLFGAFLLSLPFILLIAAYVNFIVKIAERSVILGSEKIWQALGTAHRWLFRRPGQAVLALLIEFAIQILFFMLIMAVTLIGVGLAALFAMLLAMILPQTILLAVGGAAVILFLIGIFLIAGWFASFSISYWTLIYRAFAFLTKKGD